MTDYRMSPAEFAFWLILLALLITLAGRLGWLEPIIGAVQP